MAQLNFLSMAELYMKAVFLRIGLMGICLISTSCSLMLPDRSFIAEMEQNEEQGGIFSPGLDFPVVSGDSGKIGRSRDEVYKRTPSSERALRQNRETMSLREELQAKEEDLDYRSLRQYESAKKYLSSDSDKLYYLSLNGEDKDSYIATKRADMASEAGMNHNFLSKRSVHSNEIYVGMEKDDVIGAWGRPAKVEIAGNPRHQNERWSFYEDGKTKQVYFEAGRVQGWALDL